MTTLTPHRSPVRVAVVDAHPVFRAGIVQTLLNAGGCEVVAEGEDAADAKSIAQRLAPDVMVLDLQTELNGGQIRQITDECSTVRIVILTAASGRGQINDALRAGAAGTYQRAPRERSWLKASNAFIAAKPMSIHLWRPGF